MDDSTGIGVWHHVKSATDKRAAPLHPLRLESPNLIWLHLPLYMTIFLVTEIEEMETVLFLRTVVQSGKHFYDAVNGEVSATFLEDYGVVPLSIPIFKFSVGFN